MEKVLSVKSVKNRTGKKIFNVEELNAIKSCYEGKVNKNDYIRYLVLPFLISAAFTFILLYYWWLSVIFGFLGLFFGWKVLMPKIIERNYNQKKKLEINKFINNLTQILTDDSKTITSALTTAISRTQGEFYDDILRFHARLSSADKLEARKTFHDLSEKYKDDVIFIQFLEQIETCYLEGRINLETLKDIKTYHNDIKKKEEFYRAAKKVHLNNIKMLFTLIIVFIFSITFSFGFSTYIDAFAHNFIGWITLFIYLALLIKFLNTYTKHYFDEDIMGVSL